METATISIERFRDEDGSPTCCADHSAGNTCRFLGVNSFGTVDWCMLGQQRRLHRRMRYTRPDADCEVWREPPNDGNKRGAEAAEIGYSLDPLYDQAALDAAVCAALERRSEYDAALVAAERERWRELVTRVSEAANRYGLEGLSLRCTSSEIGQTLSWERR